MITLNKNKFYFFKILRNFLAILLFITILLQETFPVSAAVIDYQAEWESRKSLPVQSNENVNWPAGPLIGAKSAILIEANSGTILYAKNIDEKMYPASTTKILTALLAVENSQMDEIVSYSQEAVFSIEPGSSNMGMDTGQEITMEQSLYGLLVGSANEAANAIGEHISGDSASFASLMNTRAKEIGCKNSNFVNANGLFDENHYTTAYDLAIIAKEFFKNDLLCKMSNTATYNIPPTAKQPDDIIVHSKNKLLAGKQYGYDYLVGSKTGFTSKCRQTLVSCARKDGLSLICVVMQEESPGQFLETLDLFNYGFSNFKKVNISENETHYSIDSKDFLKTDSDVFGNSDSFLSINSDDYVVMPTTAEFSDLTSVLSYDKDDSAKVASIDYSYNDVYVGSASVDLDILPEESNPFSEDNITLIDTPQEKAAQNLVFVNVKKIILAILIIAGALILLIMIRAVINAYQFDKRSRARRRKKHSRPRSRFRDFD